jgi:hypothetical protein
MKFEEKQILAVAEFMHSIKPQEDSRTRLEECNLMYNSDMPDCVILKYRLMGYRDGNEIDELRFMCFDKEGNSKDVRSIFSDPNARWSFYHHCKELYMDGGVLKQKK